MALTKGCRTPPAAPASATTGCSNGNSVERVCTPAPPRSSALLESVISPPSLKDEFEHSKTSSGKALPVHCIVETVSSFEEKRGPWKRHLVETDSYVIIPAGTPFHGLVQTALLRLGYTSDSAAAAKGSVLITNWKPLGVDQISDDPRVTVGDILGELTAVATLRIQVVRSRSAAFSDIKEKLLRFFLTQSQGLLINAGCPIDEICRSSFGSDGTVAEISEECRRKFDQWWSSQFCPLSPTSRGQPAAPYSAQYSVGLHASKALERSLTDQSHPAMQNVHSQFPTQKTRMRTSFDPELELPKLQKWFADNQHPSRQQIQQYVKELNGLESRRGRKPLDVNNVVYWFKNARAAQKRAEIRNITPSLSCHLPVNGYNDHSPTNGSGLHSTEAYLNTDRSMEQHMKDASYSRNFRVATRMSDEFSNGTSDIEEDYLYEEQQQSPAVSPLSLTTTSRRDSKEFSPRSVTQSTNEVHVDNANFQLQEEATNYNVPNNHQVNVIKSSVSEAEDDGEPNHCGTSPISQPISQNYCGSPDYERHLQSRVQNETVERLTGFPLVPNSMFSQSIMYMSHYIPGLSHAATSPTNSGVLGISALTADERRKRNRTFIDPVTEVPRLEQWFSLNTHPSHNLILKYTDELNCMAYRQKFPRLEPKNVQFWFKNRRAKCKRLKLSLFDNQPGVHYHHGDGE